MGDVGCGLEARGAEAVDAAGTGCVRETGGEGGGSELVGGFAIGNLWLKCQ